MAHATDIVGYTFNCENWLPEAIIAALTVNPGDTHHKDSAIGGNIDSIERHLDLLARLYGINRYDEQSYDSDEFPKVIFRDSVTDNEEFRAPGGRYVTLDEHESI